MVTISRFSFENPRFKNLLRRGNSIPKEVESTVKEVLSHVKEQGDKALYTYIEMVKHFCNTTTEQISLLHIPFFKWCHISI